MSQQLISLYNQSHVFPGRGASCIMVGGRIKEKNYGYRMKEVTLSLGTVAQSSQAKYPRQSRLH